MADNGKQSPRRVVVTSVNGVITPIRDDGKKSDGKKSDGKKSDGKKKRIQGRDFVFECYLESETQSWSDVLHWLEFQFIDYAWMCHDRCCYTDDNAEFGHKKGDIKKAHIHVLIHYDTPRNLDTVKNALSKFGITKVEKCSDSFAYLVYMTHEEFDPSVKPHYTYDRDGYICDSFRLKYLSRKRTHGKVDTMELFKLCNAWLDCLQLSHDRISMNNFCRWVMECCPDMWQVVMDNREWTAAFLGLRNYSAKFDISDDYYFVKELDRYGKC